MGNGIYINILYHPIWRIGMQETHRDINKKDSRLKQCLEICIDSLDWIRENSSLHNVNRNRAKDTLREIKRILGK